MLDKPGTSSALAATTAVPLRYQSGFLGTHETEALDGALPIGRNSPQRAPYGLYAEQLSGTAFTAPRATNRRIISVFAARATLTTATVEMAKAAIGWM